MRINKYALIIITLTVLIFIVIFPEVSISNAGAALSLWFDTVVPTLLPFFIGAGILTKTGVIKLFGAFFEPIMRKIFSLPGESAYVFMASAISGYPMGAKICADMYKEKKIDEAVAKRTIYLTSTGGPLYILGTVACGMLGAKSSGIYILGSHYIGAVAAGILTGLLYVRPVILKTGYLARIKNAFNMLADEARGQKSIGGIIEKAVTEAVTTMLLIAGMMVVFNVAVGVLEKTGVINFLCAMLKHIGINDGISRPVLTGAVELTAGCSASAQAAADISIKIPVMAFIISFGGFCVHAQTHAVASTAGLKLKHFFLAKTIQAFASFVSAFVLLRLFPLAAAVFAPDSKPADISAFAYAGSVFAAISFAALILIHISKNRRIKLKE